MRNASGQVAMVGTNAAKRRLVLFTLCEDANSQATWHTRWQRSSAPLRVGPMPGGGDRSLGVARSMASSWPHSTCVSAMTWGAVVFLAMRAYRFVMSSRPTSRAALQVGPTQLSDEGSAGGMQVQRMGWGTFSTESGEAKVTKPMPRWPSLLASLGMYASWHTGPDNQLQRPLCCGLYGRLAGR